MLQKELLNQLDLVWLTTRVRNRQGELDIKRTYREREEINAVVVPKDRKGENLKVYGFSHFPNHVTGSPTPLYDFDEPTKEQTNADNVLYHFLVPVHVDSGLLHLKETWESKVIEGPKGHFETYLGNAGSPSWIDVKIFERPISFDPKKQLLYVRSPNGSIDFQNVLDTVLLEEPYEVQASQYLTRTTAFSEMSLQSQIFKEGGRKDIAKFISEIERIISGVGNFTTKPVEYKVVYEDINELKKGKTSMRLIE